MEVTEQMKKRIDGDQCPYCGAEKIAISYDDLEVDAQMANQKACCLICDNAWTEIYHFIGVVLEDGTEIPYEEKTKGS